MRTRRCHLPGVLAVLLALAAQLGLGASVPRPDPLARFSDLVVLCHPNSPSPTPAHPANCVICPLCVAVHAPAPTLVADGLPLPFPAVWTDGLAAPPPPARGPPVHWRIAAQPRAPPVIS